MHRLLCLLLTFCFLCVSNPLMAQQNQGGRPPPSQPQQATATAKVPPGAAGAAGAVKKDVPAQPKMSLKERRKLVKDLRKSLEEIQDWLRSHNRFDSLSDIDLDSDEAQEDLDLAEKEEEDKKKKAEEEEKKRQEELEKEYEDY